MHTDSDCRQFSGELKNMKDLVKELKQEIQLLKLDNNLLSKEVSNKDSLLALHKDELNRVQNDVLCLQNSLSNYCDENVKLKNKLKVSRNNSSSPTPSHGSASEKNSNKNTKALILTTSMARDVDVKEFDKRFTGGKVEFSRRHGGKIKETFMKSITYGF